jgi:hypothetical protein
MSERGYVAVMMLRTRPQKAEPVAEMVRGQTGQGWEVKWAYAVESMWDAKPIPLTEVASDCEVIVGVNAQSEGHLHSMATFILKLLEGYVLDPKVYAGRNGFP